MSPTISEEETDDLIYFARAGESQDLAELLSTISSREGVSPAEVLAYAKDEGKSTCLHMASGNGHLEIVRSILAHFSSRPGPEKKAFLDCPNEYGNTSLHWAALGGHLEVVKLLVEEGASPTLANDKDYVPLDLAASNDKRAVVDYFFAQSVALEAGNGTNSGDGKESVSDLGSAVEGLELDGEEAGGEGSSGMKEDALSGGSGSSKS